MTIGNTHGIQMADITEGLPMCLTAKKIGFTAKIISR